MKKKIKLLLVSITFRRNSGLGIVEHGIRIANGIRKYGKNIAVTKYPLTNKIFDYANRNLRDYKVSKFKIIKIDRKQDIIHYLSPGIFMSSLFLRPFIKRRAKQIVSIHDLDMIKKIPKIGVDKYANVDKYPIKTAMSLSLINHFTNFMEKNGFKLAIKKADHIIAVSENTKEDLIKKFRIPKNRISVIYNIIGNNFRPMKKKNNGKIIIGHLSSYAYNKNAEIIVDAFKEIKSDRFELHLYGAKLPFKLPDDDRIKYFGHAHDIVKMYNSFDVFVFPSLWEGFGMPVMEAKRCKIPIITYEKGELPDIVKRNTLKFKNKKDLVDILKDMKWEKIDVNKAYKDTKECEEEVIIKKLEKVYKDVLGGK